MHISHTWRPMFNFIPGRRLARWAPPAGLLTILGATLAGSPHRLQSQGVDSTALRPATVVVTIIGDRGYDGTYRANGIARICGKLDLMMPHRVNSFVVEFPDVEPNLPVTSLSFNADTLRAGTTTGSFYLSVVIRTPGGGSPPAYVVRANEPQYNEPGTAARVKAASWDSLRVEGIATKGTKVKVDATVACQPKP